MNRIMLILLAFGFTACARPEVASPPPATVEARREAMGDAPTVEAAPAPGIRLATWNLEWLNRANGAGQVPRLDIDYDRLKGYAERLDADIVAFQEVDGPEAAQRVFDPSKYELFVANQAIAQRTGFAVKKGLSVVQNPDYVALDVGQVRAGTDITLNLDGRPLRLMSVHLKSGCFDQPLGTSGTACTKLAQQVPILEEWIDARGDEGSAAIVLGDFNRRFFGAPGEPVWAELDDSQPPASDLSSPTDGALSQCWNGEFPVFIDHIVFNRPAAQWLVAGTFAQQLYDASDAPNKAKLSDHCPISVTIRAAGGVPIDGGVPDAGPVVPTTKLIKGNINSAGRKLYHLPSCPSYAGTQIDESKGEKWFSSEAEAVAAGWTKAPNCPP